MTTKWYKDLTIANAVCIAIGIEGHEDSLQQLMLDMARASISGTLSEKRDTATKLGLDTLPRDTLKLAIDIFRALIEEAKSKQSELHIHHTLRLPDGKITYMDSTYTKASLALWLIGHDEPEMAKRVCPEMAIDNVNDKNVIPSGKGKNSYLTTIKALTEALIDGTTGHPHTDANVVLQVLATKKIEAPVKDDTLAGYLKEAAKL